MDHPSRPAKELFGLLKSFTPKQKFQAKQQPMDPESR